MEEIWKDILNYEGRYQVSNMGRIKNIKFNKILKNVNQNKGYFAIYIFKKGYLIHRLVAQAFIPNPLNKPQINHIDLNKKNNNIKNLEWVTSLENRIHARKNIKNIKFFYDAIKINQYDLNMNFIKEWRSIDEIKKFYNIKNFNINKKFNEYTNKFDGYFWKFVL